jgi:hypothetical protein
MEGYGWAVVVAVMSDSTVGLAVKESGSVFPSKKAHEHFSKPGSEITQRELDDLESESGLSL